jgi:hypothetical protein
VRKAGPGRCFPLNAGGGGVKELPVLEHRPDRPSWNCQTCVAAWPCEPARKQLAAETSGTYLIVRMSAELVEACRDQLPLPPGELYERFIGWTR